ncbi:MAG: hypothetical protein V4457_06150 [Pseudomonadota bacterium]
MADEQPTTPVLPAQPWYTSPVFKGAAVAILSQLATALPSLAAKFGLTSSDKINAAVEGVLQVVSLAATGYALVKRVKSPTSPLTLNAKAAAVHPNTVIAASQTVTTNPPIT